MKKKLLAIMALTLAIFGCTAAFTACGANDGEVSGGDQQQQQQPENEDKGDQQKPSSGGQDEEEQKPEEQQPGHKHEYNQKVAEGKFLKTDATCTKKAVYYFSCTCGEAGEQTFESGDALGHDYSKKDATEDYLVSEANCQSAAVYHYACKNCGEAGEETYTQGEPAEHEYLSSLNCENCGSKMDTQTMAKINENLENAYLKTIVTCFGSNYQTAMVKVTNCKWDLGEIVDDKVQNLKLIFHYNKNSTSNTTYVYKVKLNSEMTFQALTNTELQFADVVCAPEYSYNYNPSLQGDKDELIEAVAKAMNTKLNENFDYQNATKLYTDKGVVDTGAGTQRMYKIVLINNNGIREYDISLLNDSINGMINKINNGNFVGSLTKSVDFSTNILENI